MAFFPRFIESEFAPVFRLIDNYADHINTRNSSRCGQSFKNTRLFAPKFDVKESKESYELQGELPGIEQQNIQVEFTDAQTLTIKGRTERHRNEGVRPSGLIESQAGEQDKLTEGDEQGNNYHKPSVEDDETLASAAESDTPQETPVESPKRDEQQSRYWVSERSVGEFARTFSFPNRVDQDNVKASLKDGILSIVVPKAQAPISRQINIE